MKIHNPISLRPSIFLSLNQVLSNSQAEFKWVTALEQVVQKGYGILETMKSHLDTSASLLWMALPEQEGWTR